MWSWVSLEAESCAKQPNPKAGEMGSLAQDPQINSTADDGYWRYPTGKKEGGVGRKG